MTDLFSNVVDWVSIPITGIVGLLGFHYKKTVSDVKELDSRVDKIQIRQAIVGTDLHYIKRSCDQITEKLEKIEEKLNRQQTRGH